MDVATLGGMLGGLMVIVFGVISSAGVGGFKYFMDAPSFIITIGGSICSLLASRKIADVKTGLKSMKYAIHEPACGNPNDVIKQIIEMSNISRKEGLLALESYADNISDDFMKKGVMLIVDGTEGDLVRSILESDMSAMDDRHKSVQGFWDYWSTQGPAWGMIGTLIGLVIMLQNMSDAASIGPAMAVALITTLYGSVLANWICVPTCEKLKENNSIELSVRSIMVEGILSIQAGENPHIIEEKLKTFIAPADRQSAAEGEGEGAAAGGNS